MWFPSLRQLAWSPVFRNQVHCHSSTGGFLSFYNGFVYLTLQVSSDSGLAFTMTLLKNEMLPLLVPLIMPEISLYDMYKSLHSKSMSSWSHKGNLYLFICILFGMFSCQHNNKAVDTALFPALVTEIYSWFKIYFIFFWTFSHCICIFKYFK